MNLSPVSGFPAIVVPAGFTRVVYDRVPDASDPNGSRLEGPKPDQVPVAMEFLALCIGLLCIALGPAIAQVPGSARPTIAVLPFENNSGDAAQNFFAEGMTDEIATALTGVPGIGVVARSSSFQLKQPNRDIKAIGAALNASHLVQGSAPDAPFDNKGIGSGYVLTFGDTRIYFSGDTECVPEIKALKEQGLIHAESQFPLSLTLLVALLLLVIGLLAISSMLFKSGPF